MQPLGQHFLKNRSVIPKIIAALQIGRGDTIIEIGPGHGELTFPLAEACAEAGAAMIAVEKDKRLAEGLAGRIEKTVDVRNADILEFLRDEAPDLRTVKLVGNIPYYITGKLLRTAGELARKPERSILMVQNEVAERIIAEPPKMNRLAASVQFWAEPAIIARVPKEDFSPPPKVGSAIIALKTKGSLPADAARYYEAMRTLFAQPRKTIANNLLSAKREVMTREALARALADAGVRPEARPQDLTTAKIAAIADLLF